MNDPMTNHIEVLRGLVAFLNGEAPLDGCWFGEDPPPGEGRYWWRKPLNAALSAQAEAQAGGAVRVHTPVVCQNGHRATWTHEFKGLDVRSLGVGRDEDCPCPKHNIDQGWTVAGPSYTTPPAKVPEGISDDAIKVIWRAAMTGAHNICIKRSDRWNDEDGPSDRIDEANECAKEIAGWLEADDAFIAEVRAMLAAPAAKEGA